MIKLIFVNKLGCSMVHNMHISALIVDYGKIYDLSENENMISLSIIVSKQKF